jgi:maltooligosyltrehalose trehalohydrolase
MTRVGWRGFPLRDACIYELHVGTFTPEGTFGAIASKLDHLSSLGVNAIELMPVTCFPGDRGWGYDVLDLRSVHPPYGTGAELKRLIDAAHERGIAVICDVVYNHVGPGADVARAFGPHHTTTRYSTPWGAAINLDGPDSDETRAFILDNVEMWFADFGFDGLRLDAIDALVDTSAVHILEEIGLRVRALEARLGRTLWVIAESDLNDPRVVWERARGGYGMDAQWSDDFHHSLHAFLTGDRFGYYVDFGRVEQVTKALQRAFVLDGGYSRFRQRKHGRPADGLSGHRFVGYLQNHDQVGNRMGGERSVALMSPALAQVGAALVLTAPFVPLLFMGEEWGARTPFLYFTDHSDPDLARAVREGRASGEFAEFGWAIEDVPDPQDPATFEASRLRWSELDDPRHADILDWHRRLIRLRRELPDLADGRMDRVRTSHSEEPPWLVVERGAVTIACNFAAVPVEVPVRSTGAELLLTSSKDPEPRGDSLKLAPESVVILHDLHEH